MRLLIIDTSLEACAVAVAAGARVVERSEIIGRGHAERLFGMVEEAMAEAGMAFADLDRIAVTVGPGSFTGVRIGVAAARGFALVARCEVVGLSTLAGHAETARAIAPGTVLALLSGRGGEVQGQVFDSSGNTLTEAVQGKPEDFAALADTFRAGLAGSGADAVAALRPGIPVLHRRSAPELAALVKLGQRNDGLLPPKPLYLRPPDAVPVKSPVFSAP